MEESDTPRACLLVCVKCRGEDPETLPRAGERLYERLRSEVGTSVEVQKAECLSNCNRGCTIALRGPQRWTFVYGDIVPEDHLPEVVEGIRRYKAAPDGLVPWKQRPLHFRKHCIARLPPEKNDHE